MPGHKLSLINILLHGFYFSALAKLAFTGFVLQKKLIFSGVKIKGYSI